LTSFSSAEALALALALALAKLTEEITERSGNFVGLIGDLRCPGMFDQDRYDGRANMLNEISETKGRGTVDLMGKGRGSRRNRMGRNALRRRVIAQEKAPYRRGQHGRGEHALQGAQAPGTAGGIGSHAWRVSEILNFWVHFTRPFFGLPHFPAMCIYGVILSAQ
jgi:hypothetical protein